MGEASSSACFTDPRLHQPLSSSFDSFSPHSRVQRDICSGADEFLRCLGHLHHVDCDTRLTGTHIEYESDTWKYVEKTLMSMDMVATQLVRWCQKDKTVLGAVTK